MSTNAWMNSENIEAPRLLSATDIANVLSSPEDAELKTEILEDFRAMGFSSSKYLEHYSDLMRENFNEIDSLKHYVRHGFKEGRIFPFNVNVNDIMKIKICRSGKFSYDMGIIKTIVNKYFQIPENKEFRDWQCPLPMAVDSYQSMGIKPYIMIGDSHSQAYRFCFEHKNQLIAPIHYICMAGSAGGLINKNSRSGYGVSISNYIEKNGEFIATNQIPVLLKFGQVDAEFVYFFRVMMSESFEFSFSDYIDFVEGVVGKYERFIVNLMDAEGVGGLLRVVSCFPPALSDVAWKTGYLNARIARFESDLEGDTLKEKIKNVKIPNIFLRTRMHKIFNAYLQIMCAKIGVEYINDFDMCVSNSNYCGERVSTVRDSLIKSHKGSDHHLDFFVLRNEMECILKNNVFQ